MTEDNLTYFTETAPGVFVLKKPIGPAVGAMVGSWLPFLILLGAQVGGFVSLDWLVIASMGVVGAVGSVVVLLELIVKTVIDQNQRTVTGLMKRSWFPKMKTTVSFDVFHGFSHVKKERRLNQFTDAKMTTSARLDMIFLHKGTPTRHLTIMPNPDEDAMAELCSEVNFLMGN